MDKPNTTSALNKYLREVIALSRKDVSSAVASRNWFLQRIQNVIDSRKNELVLYSPEPFFVYGSYAKNTKVCDVDEFDIMVVIDSNGGTFSKGGSVVGNGLGSASPNPKYQDKYYKSDGSGISPSIILNWLKSVVKEVTDAFGGDAPIRNGQAVTATIKSKNLAIDLVPGGIFKRVSDDKIFYNIPSGDCNNSWLTTSPRDDIALLDQRAEKRNNFKNIIRLTKHIKVNYNFRVSSFAIETAAIHYVYRYAWNNDLFTDLVSFLNYLADQFRAGCIPDSFDNSVNLLEGVQNASWYADRIFGIVSSLDLLEEDYNDFPTLFSALCDILENRD